MKKFKKAQGALELILILVFVFILIGVVMYIVGLEIIDLQNKEKEKELDDFASSILNEFEILIKVEDGYYKELEIPNYLLKKFNFTINRSHIIISSTEREGEDAQKYYYFIPGGINPEIVVRNIGGEVRTYLIVEKKDLPEQGEYLQLK